MNKVIIFAMILLTNAVIAQSSIPMEQNPLTLTEGDATQLVFVAGIIKMYDYAIQKDPGNIKIRRRFVGFLEESGQLSRALAEAKKILELSPTESAIKSKVQDLHAKLGLEPEKGSSNNTISPQN